MILQNLSRKHLRWKPYFSKVIGFAEEGVHCRFFLWIFRDFSQQALYKNLLNSEFLQHLHRNFEVVLEEVYGVPADCIFKINNK